MIKFKTLGISFVLTILFAALAQAAFTLPERITVPSRLDGGQLKTDVVQDGAETVPLSGTSGAPIALFSDLISGPDTGLGDSLGSGVIVTVWGQFLGSTQGSSVVEYCDSASVCRAGHVYYWKNADGALPSGPANLYESHGMQEIAFSIPDSAMGAGNIRVRVGADTTTLPFTVRTGRIVHVKTTGNDANPGTFASPLLTVARADQGGFAQLGDTVYIHGVSTGGPTVDRAIYNNSGLMNTYTNQFAYVSYPNTRAPVYGGDGVHIYIGTGFVTSKLSIFSSNCNATGGACFQPSAAGIEPSDFGRVIANAITDQPNGCANSQAGAITGGSGGLSGAKIYGNYIYDYSCPEAAKFHHTTYFTVRDVYPNQTQDETMQAFELGWNYLKDNKAKNGLHVYDEDHSANHDLCGDLAGDLLIHNNVVINQAGTGIEYMINCGWSQDTYIYNNVLINTGLISSGGDGALASAMHIGGGILYGDISIYNNTIHTWDSQNMPDQGTSNACLRLGGGGEGYGIFFNDNVCLTPGDKPFFGLGYGANNMADNVTGSKNAMYYAGAGTPAIAVNPSWNTSPTTGNPLITVTGSRISVGAGSTIINQSTTTIPRDVYGVLRGSSSNLGAVNGSN